MAQIWRFFGTPASFFYAILNSRKDGEYMFDYPNCTPFRPQNYQPPQQVQVNTLIKVNGLNGAKAYQMPANQAVALFDQNDDYFYVKSTDGAGFPTIKTFKFEEVTDAHFTQNCDYVTREEMEEYVKQLIRTAKAKLEAGPTTNAQPDPRQPGGNL